MKSIFIVLIFVIVADAWKIKSAETIQSALTTCADQVAAPEKLRAQWRKFRFPIKDPNKSECYVRCIFEKLEILKDSRIQRGRLYKQLEKHVDKEKQERFRDHVNGCVKEFKGHSCMKVFQIFSCLQLGFKKEVQAAFKAKKKILHTEVRTRHSTQN